MNPFTALETSKLERVLDISNGYVMDLKDDVFNSILRRNLGRDISKEAPYKVSKAKRFYYLLENESSCHIGRIISELLEYSEVYHKKNSGGSQLDEIKDDIARLRAKAVALAEGESQETRHGPFPHTPTESRSADNNGKKYRYKVFISHASQDKALVDALMVLLQLGLNIPYEAIYNTDKVDGQIPTEADFAEEILTALRDSEIAIFLITPTFLKRPNCLMEFGAALAYKTRKVCYTALGISHCEFQTLSFVIKEQNGYDISNADHLYEIAKNLNIKELNTPRWMQEVSKFKAVYASLLNAKS